MKHGTRQIIYIFILLLVFFSCTRPELNQVEDVTLTTSDTLLNQAFELAVWTIDHNTHNGLLEAGGGYGGEWTRDCAMNCWNAASLLRPEVAVSSLWSVTNDSITIGHQYWDKIVWTIAAYNHYLVTGDQIFLEKAFNCASTTMEELEEQCYDSLSGLFMGPAVFQDGIAGYDEPIYDSTLWDDSFVLHHPNSATIKCLSTNALYYQAYRTLAQMDIEMAPFTNLWGKKAYLPTQASGVFDSNADTLKERIRETFFRPEENKLYYLIDHQGHPHDYQEGLGLAFSMLFDLLTPEESAKVVEHAYISEHGIPCVYPSFPRNTPDKPGRHNMMIWPHVNMYYASGCAHQGQYDSFYNELYNLADLAINRGEGDFYEIYTLDGEPSGGYQCGGLWDKKEHQTWCATGYLRCFLNHIFGLTPTPEGLELHPIGMRDGSECKLEGIHYRNTNLAIIVRGHGDNILKCNINGKRKAAFIPSNASGDLTIEITLG